MTTLSACIIIRNEAKNIPGLMRNISTIVDEVIVVDTGSTDTSLKLLEQFPKATVYTFEWCDDFSKARNFALDKATSDWIIVLDADERLQQTDTLREEMANAQRQAYYLTCRNLQPKGSLVTYEEDKLIRLFKNDPTYRYEGRIHEQISPSIQRESGRVGFSDCVIVHGGYRTDVVQGSASRRERNLKLIAMALEENPTDHYYLYHLGTMYQSTEPTRAYELFESALQHGEPNISPHLRESLYVKMAQVSLSRNLFPKAIAEAQQALRLNPNNLIAHVCLITTFVTVNGYPLAIPHLDWVLEHALAQVPNPKDFVQLRQICSQSL